MIRFPILLLCFISCNCAQVPMSRTRVVIAGAQAKASHSPTVDLGNIEEEHLLEALQKIQTLALTGQRDITIRIDSFGGSIFLGLRFGRVVEDLKKTYGIRTTCIVDGAAFSMAAVLLESPMCDRRLATARSAILFHNGSSGVRGTAEEMKKAAVVLEVLNEAMALQVSSRIGMPLAIYRAKIANGDWIMAMPEAMACNVIDGLIAPNEIAPPAVAP